MLSIVAVLARPVSVSVNNERFSSPGALGPALIPRGAGPVRCPAAFDLEVVVLFRLIAPFQSVFRHQIRRAEAPAVCLYHSNLTALM